MMLSVINTAKKNTLFPFFLPNIPPKSLVKM